MVVHTSMVVTEGFRAGSWRERKRKENSDARTGPRVKTIAYKSFTKHRVLESSLEENWTGQPVHFPAFILAMPDTWDTIVFQVFLTRRSPKWPHWWEWEGKDSVFPQWRPLPSHHLTGTRPGASSCGEGYQLSWLFKLWIEVSLSPSCKPRDETSVTLQWFLSSES